MEVEKMITVDDFVSINVSHKMQLKAADYAGCSIHYTYDRMRDHNLLKRLHHIVVGILIEEAFSSWLKSNNVDYAVSGQTHWRKRDSAEFIIRDKLVDVKGAHVYPYSDRRFPQWLLPVDGLVPVDQCADETIYVQAALVAPPKPSRTSPLFIALPPRGWAKQWSRGSQLRLDHSMSSPNDHHLILAGESDRVGKTSTITDYWEHISLENSSSVTDQVFCSLQYLMLAEGFPTSLRVSIEEAQERKVMWSLTSDQWYNLGFESPTVYLLGWGVGNDYKRGKMLPRYSKHQIYYKTRTNNFSVPLSQLNPMNKLLDL